MLKLLKIEWLKIKKYKAFLILSCLFVVSIIGINYLVHEIVSLKDNPLSMFTGQAFKFPKVWQTVSYLSSFLLFIPGLITIFLVSNEFSFRTHRQNIIDGISRSQFINTKIAMIFVFSLAATMVVFLTASIFGLIEKSSLSFSYIKYIPYYFIQSVSYLSIALLFVLLFKRSGLSIGVYFIYIFIIEDVLGVILNRYLEPLGNYLPLESADKLIKLPISLGITNTPQVSDIYLLISCSIWIITCLALCKYKFEKHDL
ncbi:ABC transporter permease [Bacteroidales bacterium OttesenSCG-928-I14]|nr:ABC transporter permease [Bacteroidales bacterium OttesenSCG-928-I14]